MCATVCVCVTVCEWMCFDVRVLGAVSLLANETLKCVRGKEESDACARVMLVRVMLVRECSTFVCVNGCV